MFVMAETPVFHRVSTMLHTPTALADFLQDDTHVGDTLPSDTLPTDTFPTDTILSDSLTTDSLLTDSLAADALVGDSLSGDTLAGQLSRQWANMVDTTKMDSLQLAVWKRNKAVDDSIAADSANRQRKNGIDAPVVYSANDSITYDGKTGVARLFGDSKVKYENMDLQSDRVRMHLDSSMVHAVGTPDTLGKLIGRPVFVQGTDKYESDTMSFNFKTKKGFITDVYTQQEDGYLTSMQSKRNDKGELFLQHGRYTTCDDPHPDFYISLSRAKVRPGKDVVFGPAYLVVADVPMPLAIPYGFFPFSKSYSSGFIMPTYGDETTRGFYLRDGGYYFAISDKIDLKLIGEIYTKGSWGVSAASNYRRRYKYSGSLYASYQSSVTGEKNLPDYSKTESFKLQWTHRQDQKANPYSTLTANVNFATTSYERNNLSSMYNPTSYTQSTRTSSVSYSTNFSSIGMNISTSMNVSQNMRDSSISLTLPDLNISVSRFYPFRRKKAAGKERWYEKIAVSYTGQFSNSITTKENKLLKSNLIKDWKNGMNHRVPVQANFTVLDYINVSPSFSFTDRMYTDKINRSWNETTQREVTDTVYGFYNIYNWNMSLGLSTKLYGMYVPSRKIFGDKIVAVRHVFTPTVSMNYAPDFGSPRYGFWDTYTKTDAKGNVSTVTYSPFSHGIYGVPGRGKTGSISMGISNNIEMKVRTDNDSTKKISIIDELGAQMSYNFAAKSRPWSDLNTTLRLKLSKSYTFSLNAVFATYAYELDENGRPYVGERTEYSYGRFGRFQGMSQNLSYTFDNNFIKKIIGLFTGEKLDDDSDKRRKAREDYENDVESNVDPDMEAGKHGAEDKNSKVQTDEDGYMKFSMPWSVSVSYGITMRENTSGEFNKKRMRYPYKFTQNLNFSGNLRLSDGWNISFSSGYDFERKKLSMTTASLGRDLHCFNMSCSVVLTPYTSYNFSFRCNASTLTDALKYDKRSSYSNAVQWY